MSIVIVGITPKFAIAMSDGRVTNPNSLFKNENFNKILKFNQYSCVGITGNLDFYKILFDKYNSLKKDIKNIKSDQLFQLFYDISKDIYSAEKFDRDSAMVVCGVTTNNKIESIGFSTKDFIILRQDAEETGIAIQVLCDYPNSFKIAQNYIIGCGDLISGMEKTIKYIATVDETVNSNIFAERIDLQ